MPIIQDALDEQAYKTDDTGITLQKTASIRLSCLYLYPTDCLSIGYFARYASGWIDEEVCLFLDLSTSLMGDMEIKALLQELCKPALKKNVYLSISGICMSATTLHTLSTKFTPKSCLSGLELTISYVADMQLAMKYLIEGYARSHCKYLGLEGCCSEIIHHLICS